MKSFHISYGLAALMILLLVGGNLAGCASPAQEISQPNEVNHPGKIEEASMSPYPQQQEPTQVEAIQPPEPGVPVSSIAHSSKVRAQNPDISEDTLQELTAGNSAFAIDLYHALREGDRNLFYSPYSISLALSMAYAGARGKTASEMSDTLHFKIPDDSIHSGFNALDLALASRNNEDDEMMPGFKLNIANSAWVQYNRPFEQAFLDLLAENYAAGLNLTDYVRDPEGARLAINEWIHEATEGKIEDLIPAGAINTLTRLVLANAIYFKAGWQNTFDETLTKEAAFTRLDGNQVSVAMMETSEPARFGYAARQGYQAVELPYNGGELSMVILLPNHAEFEAFEASLNAEKIADLLESMETKHVELKMPKFNFESALSLSDTLMDLGIEAAFDLQNADFSGIDGTKELFISDVIHKAFISVDEKGTEAAAATAIVFRATSLPVTEVQLTIDHPFIFLIQDKPTGTILFLGRVLDPSQ